MTPDLLSSLSLSTPELILAVGALVLLMIGAYSRSNNTMTGLAVLVLVVAGLWLVFSGGQGAAYGGAFVQDAFGAFMKMLALIGSAVTLVMSMRFARQEHFDKFEFPVLVLLCTLGMLLMISANGMIGLYLGLELQSLAI
ncbi:MAG: NADH-quinone oxidoreductase subunit N, partial [Mesorhizobium sp.]